MPNPASLYETMSAVVEAGRLDLHTAMPAKVISFSPTAGTVVVQPVVKPALPKADGTVDFEDLPQIADVPVMFPRASGYFLTVPLAPGDFVWLMFCEHAIGGWRATGQDGAEATDTRRHSLGYPFAMPGAFPDTALLTDGSTTGSGMKLGRDNDEAQIHLDPGVIKLGKTATQFVALANLVQTALDALVDHANNHTHPVAGATADPTLVPLAAVGPVAAANIKAK